MTEPRIVVMPADHGACGHLRLAWPGEAMWKQGADVHVSDAGFAVTGGGELHRDGWHPITDIVEPPFDIVVVQRPCDQLLVECLEVARAKYGLRVVVDLDDDIKAVPPDNRSYRAMHPRFNPRVNWNNLHRALRVADVVTVSTPALARRYGGGRAVVVPNRVPAAALHEPDPDREVRFGWSGSRTVHGGDLEVTRGAVSHVVDVEEFTVVGEPAGVGRALGFRKDPTGTGWLPLLDYYKTLAESYTVGIVPLAPTAFNESKSGLKVLDHAAVGIPSVMSPTADNLRLHHDGIGYVAERPKHWANRLRQLRDHRFRTDAAWRAYEAAAGHTIEAHVDEWASAWLSSLSVPA